ncbi:MAG TPA: hypothetical protein VG538_11770 [Vicinamibacterales bacterium]|jgi:hypothetical protein|nr:hypothetical protein [Vicinamibacterales bacterium]
MTDPRRQFETKAAWHEAQRRLSPREKVRLVIALQHREVEINRLRVALGRPPIPMRPWNAEP